MSPKESITYALRQVILSSPDVSRSYIMRAMSALGDRIRKARENAGLSQQQVAAFFDISRAAVAQWEQGKTAPDVERASKLARVLNCSAPWLLLGMGDIGDAKLPQIQTGGMANLPHGLVTGLLPIGDTEYASIGRYDARLSAGPGSIVVGEEPDGHMLFEAQWLRAITTTAPDRLAVLRVDGDSMESTLSDRDFVLVDRSQNRFGKEGIYALRVGENCWVKRLSLNLRDRLIRIISDNPRYPVQELPEEEIDLIGRVVWIVGRRV